LLRFPTSARSVDGRLLGLVECGHSHSIPGDVSPGWCYVAAISTRNELTWPLRPGAVPDVSDANPARVTRAFRHAPVRYARVNV
jgi:hypothetical protein